MIFGGSGFFTMDATGSFNSEAEKILYAAACGAYEITFWTDDAATQSYDGTYPGTTSAMTEINAAPKDYEWNVD